MLSAEQQKEIQYKILDVLYDEHEKDNLVIMLRDIVEKIGVDLPTVASEAQRMARQGLIKFFTYGVGVKITDEGIRRRELLSSETIPGFFKEPLPKGRKALEQKLSEMWQIRGRSDSVEAEFVRLKIEEINGELEWMDRRSTRCYARIALAISFLSLIGAIVALVKVFSP